VQAAAAAVVAAAAAANVTGAATAANVTSAAAAATAAVAAAVASAAASASGAAIANASAVATSKGAGDGDGESEADGGVYGGHLSAFSATYLGMLGEFRFDFENETDDPLKVSTAKTLYLFFVLVTNVTLFNLLIAMMSNTYRIVQVREPLESR
jgi:hypothetical protein